MCGICGRTSDPLGEAVAAMNAQMVHRGPDDSGLHIDPQTGAALGARRLSIIDPQGGHQPLASEDGSVWAVLNGELYNHPALQTRLRARGHRLRNNCDTEVLVHLYEDHGDAFVHALEGMFVLAVWDARRRRLLIARDRYGEKPLFYSELGGNLTFASELKALLAGLPGAAPELDAGALERFLVFGYVAGRRTLVDGVYALPPGHLLRWDLQRKSADVAAYWQPPRSAGTPAALGEIQSELRFLLQRSVSSRMVADVPLGVFLSGGLDSTLVTGLAVAASSAAVKTFTVGYDTGAVNELEPARSAARCFGTDHHELIVTQADVAAEIPELLRRLDQPIADPALPPLHLLCRFARQQVTVAVGGEGADELFGGYPRYRWLGRAEQLRRVVPSAMSKPVASALKQWSTGRLQRLADVVEPMPPLERHLDWVTDHRRHQMPLLYGPRLRVDDAARRVATDLDAFAGRSANGDVAGTFMWLDQRHWLPDDVLTKADRASMLASLELRTPFLHRELAELAAAVPSALHLQGGGKALLRGALTDLTGGTLPIRRKTAFRAPTAEWIRGPLAAALDQQIRHGALFAEGWLDRRDAAMLFVRHIDEAADHSRQLWPILCVGLWLDTLRGDDGS